MELMTLLQLLTNQNGSDLHLVVGEPPVFRIDGALVRLDADPIEAEEMEALLFAVLSEEQQALLTGVHRALDLTLRQEGRAYRGHIFYERGRLGAGFRQLPQSPPAIETLYGDGALASLLHTLIQKPRGLILVTGPTGSGKSTTCAAMLESINRTRTMRIFTLEDPADYEFESKQSLITQRMVGQDVPGFAEGVRSTLHADPDVVYIGELRDRETVQLTLAVAETGHLVFSVMHSETTSEAVQRLIEVFPEPRDTVQRMLARNLVAIIAQRLVPRAGRPGRVAVNEVLLVNARVRRMIAEGQTDLRLAIEAGRLEGMQTMDDSLINLYRSGTISYETAWSHILEHERLGPFPEVPATEPEEAMA